MTTGFHTSDENIPIFTELYFNYPNPFNPSTIIKYYLHESNKVTLNIFNIHGQKVATLIDDYQNSGMHQVQWATQDLLNVSSGLYIYQLQVGRLIKSKKMILLK